MLKPNGVKKKDNRKIKSRKTTIDGIEFDSILEAFCYRKMTEAGFKFEIKKEYEILKPFTYRGSKIRPMRFTPDFYIPETNTIVETKGLANESFPLRLKIFMWIYSALNGGSEPEIVILKNQKEVSQWVLERSLKLKGYDDRIS